MNSSPLFLLYSECFPLCQLLLRLVYKRCLMPIKQSAKQIELWVKKEKKRGRSEARITVRSVLGVAGLMTFSAAAVKTQCL